MLNQSITEMTLQDLESVINKIVDARINQIYAAKDIEREPAELRGIREMLQLAGFEEAISNTTLDKSNPFVQFDGIFKDDPLFDDFVEEMAKNRRELDAEMAAYEASLEEK